MRKAIIIASSVLLVGGCSAAIDEDTTNADTSITETKPKPAEPAISEEDVQEAAFLTLAKDVFPGVPDSDLIGLAESTCEAIDASDGDVETVLWGLAVEFAEESAKSIENAGYFVGISIAYACPEYNDQIQ